MRVDQPDAGAVVVAAASAAGRECGSRERHHGREGPEPGIEHLSSSCLERRRDHVAAGLGLLNDRDLRLEPSGPTWTLLRWCAMQRNVKASSPGRRRAWMEQDSCRDRRSGREPSPRRGSEPKMKLPLKSTALAVSAFALLGAAGAAQAAEYANVVSATPVTGSFPVPRQQCAEGTQVVPAQPSGGGALVGAIIGGVRRQPDRPWRRPRRRHRHRRRRRRRRSATTPRWPTARARWCRCATAAPSAATRAA